MSYTSTPTNRMRLIRTLWSLLFIKCFILEYFVRKYDIPIHSLIYVWTLSIFMASIATVIYTKLHTEERRTLFQSVGFRIFILSGIPTGIIVALSVTQLLDTQAELGLGLAAIAIGAGHLWMRIKGVALSGAWVTRGWFCGAAALVYAGAPLAFAIFALCIFCFSFLPGATHYFAHRKEAALA